MSTVVVELYEALKQAGVAETLAKDAACAVMPANAFSDLATKGDLNELRLATKGDFNEFQLATKGDLDELHLATQGDIGELRSEVKADLASLRSEVKADVADLRSELKADLAGVRHEMSEMKGELIKWNVGLMAIMTAIFAAIAHLT